MISVFQSIAAATLFSVYQVLIKRSGLNWSATLLLMGIGYFAVALPINVALFLADPKMDLPRFLFRPDVWIEHRGTPPMPLIAAMLVAMVLGLLAGILNGGGHVFYQQLIATPLADLSNLTVTIPMGCLMIGIATAVLGNGERLTWNRAGAVAAALVAVLLANRR